MLLQIILLVFALLGIAAATVDFGFARVAQAQMQNGVDTAALETLRTRDSVAENRHNARLYAWNTYVDPSGTRLVGAGADLTLTGGEPGRNGLQTISVGSDPVYRPCLALNVANLSNGDVVKGTAKTIGDRPASYADDYTRYIDPAGAQSAVLVRMRRTGYRPEGGPDTPDPDPACDSETTSVSAGPGVPLLFGLGTTIQPNASGYSVRTHGLTVRATAVADARPVRRMAASYVGPFALTRSFWEASAETLYTFTCDAAGVVSVGGSPSGFRWNGAVPVRIGMSFTVNSGAGCPGVGIYNIPVYVDYGGSRVVIGFGKGTIEEKGVNLLFTPMHNRVADTGASALAADGISGAVAPIAYLSNQNATLLNALRAPALLR